MSDDSLWDDLLTAYLLGELSDADRARFDELLATSAERRAEVADYERVTGLLKAWGEPAATESAPDAAPPASLDARIDDLLGTPSLAPVVPLARRPRRWLPVATALAGAAAGVAGVLLVVDSQQADPAPAGPTVLAVTDLQSEPGVRASAGVVDHTWGVEVQFSVTGLPAGAAYEVVVTADDGTRYDAGAFVGVNREVNCRMNSAVLLADAQSFAVLDPSGQPVVWGDLPDPA